MTTKYIVTHEKCGSYLGEITISKRDIQKAQETAERTWKNNPVKVREAK